MLINLTVRNYVACGFVLIVSPSLVVYISTVLLGQLAGYVCNDFVHFIMCEVEQIYLYVSW